MDEKNEFFSYAIEEAQDGFNVVRKASKLAYREGVYFCLDCAIYFPCKTLMRIMENEK